MARRDRQTRQANKPDRGDLSKLHPVTFRGIRGNLVLTHMHVKHTCAHALLRTLTTPHMLPPRKKLWVPNTDVTVRKKHIDLNIRWVRDG
jgi:hypothetical protein